MICSISEGIYFKSNSFFFSFSLTRWQHCPLDSQFFRCVIWQMCGLAPSVWFSVGGWVLLIYSYWATVFSISDGLQHKSPWKEVWERKAECFEQCYNFFKPTLQLRPVDLLFLYKLLKLITQDSIKVFTV